MAASSARSPSGDVADAVKAAGGPQLDRRKIELVDADQVRRATHQALVRLHPEVQATVALSVVAG